MNNPKVTIATITYNSSKFVRQTIESVLAQSFTDFEYLISDDCSIDNTWEIIQEYSDPRIRAWRNDENLTEYPNRNKTLKEAKGEYIIWIDGDDIFYPHGLEFMVKMLNAFPNSAMACARPYWPNIIYPYELTPVETFRYEFLGSPVLVNGFPDTLFRTENLRKAGGLPEDMIAGDTFAKRKVGLNWNTLLISKDVSWWRRTPGQASSLLNTIEGVRENYFKSLEILNDELMPLNPKEKKTAIENLDQGILKFIAKNFLFKGKVYTAYKEYKSFNRSKPLHFKLLFKKREFYQNGSATDPLFSGFYKNPFLQNGYK